MTGPIPTQFGDVLILKNQQGRLGVGMVSADGQQNLKLASSTIEYFSTVSEAEAAARAIAPEGAGVFRLMTGTGEWDQVSN